MGALLLFALFPLVLFGAFAGSDDDDDVAVPVNEATNGDDELYGSDEPDRIDALAGDDFVNGFGGDDLITFGAGNDLGSGGAGSDTLYGGAGEDSLLGGTGDDTVYLGEGDDLSSPEIADVAALDAGNDVILGGGGNDIIRDSLGSDTLYGNAGNDLLVARSEGVAGADELFGGIGSDTLEAGYGSTMTGGAGADVFGIYTIADDNEENAPVVITDYDESRDTLIVYLDEVEVPAFNLFAEIDTDANEVRLLLEGQLVAVLANTTSYTPVTQAA